jgi:hypothetical protein
METRQINGIALFYHAEDQESAELIGGACSDSARVVQESWDLSTPENLRVYVMTEWKDFLYHSAPGYYRLLLTLAMPFYRARYTRYWEISAGWSMGYWNRPTIGIKPPHILQEADTEVGSKVFIEVEEMDQRVKMTTCHELVHAASVHLRLPMWLNEGLAMLTVEKYQEMLTVKTESLALVESGDSKVRPESYRILTRLDPQGIATQYARCYWFTRYLDEEHPDMLKGFLEKRLPLRVLNTRAAEALEVPVDELFYSLDRTVVEHFGEG